MVYATSSYCEKARLTSAGFAYFHSRMDLPGNNSDNLSAMGQDTETFPVSTWETKAGETPRISAILICDIVVFIISAGYVNVLLMSIIFF
jgi:hypothetical protein